MFRPSVPIRLIRHLPLGRGLALRFHNRWQMHLRRHAVAKTYFGAKLACDAHDMIQATIRHFGVWEPAVSHAIQRALRPGDIFADVGANIGYYSLLGSSCVGAEGHVVAIEAHPAIAAQLQGNLNLNQTANVRVIGVAASDQAGEIELFEAPGTNIGMTTTLAERGFTSIGKVPMLPFHSLFNDAEAQRLAVIKVDVEGAELPILRDVIHHLDRFPCLRAIIVEASPTENEEWTQCFDMLRASGFEAFDLHNDYRWVSLLAGTILPPSEVDRLPTVQSDLLFKRDPGVAG